MQHHGGVRCRSSTLCAALRRSVSPTDGQQTINGMITTSGDHAIYLGLLVGVAGFEPAASSSRRRDCLSSIGIGHVGSEQLERETGRWRETGQDSQVGESREGPICVTWARQVLVTNR
jgi:hypothetical protein